MKNLLNLKNNKNGEPDFIINKKGYETKIYLDLQTKIDIIKNSL